jgi:hypothetical protein
MRSLGLVVALLVATSAACGDGDDGRATGGGLS